MPSKKLSSEGLEELINKFIVNANEERDLALERYRRQDEAIVTPEDFVLQGKNAVDFLKTASSRSDALLQAAKLIKEVVYDKKEGGASTKTDLNDNIRTHVLRTMKENKEL